MSNLIPDRWSFEAIGNFIADSVAGEWGAEPKGDENDIPVLRATNFSLSGAIDYKKLAIRNIEEKKRLRKSLVKGDVVIEKSGGSPTQPVGRVIYFENNIPFLYSNFTQKLSPIKNVNSKFMFYKLYFEYLNGVVLKFQQQTTGIINLQLAEYLLYKSLFPPLPEQQKIAAILTSVDEVIEKTQAQIDKLKDLKSGMIQELLTKGVGIKQGDKYEPHTEFKDSPVGRIPKNWKVVSLENLVKDDKKITYGIVQAGPHHEGGIPYIRVSDMNSRYLTKKGMLLTSPEIAKKFERSAVSAGDIVYALRGMIGHVHIIPNELDGANLTQGTARISPSSNIDTGFLLWAMRSPYVAEQNDLEAKGSTFKEVTLASLRKIQIAVPLDNEQKFISAALTSVESKIFATEDKLEQTKNLKKALMQDLLTGKVRVRVDNDLVV